MDAKDILVRTSNPEVLDRTVQAFGAVVVGGGTPEGYVKVEGCYVVRCFRDPGFVKWAITRQGYGEVVRELEEVVLEIKMKSEGRDKGVEEGALNDQG